MWCLIVAIAILLIYFYYQKNKSSTSEGLARYYMPFTQKDLVGSCWGATVPRFYEPTLLFQTNKCGEYGYNF